MKCPRCDGELVPAVHHRITVQACPTCAGMWFERKELEELEDEAFDFGEHAKGTLVFGSTPTQLKCPECGVPLRQFQYRFYDLEMQFCDNQHGYWLEKDEDTRVLELMKREESEMRSKLALEDRWAATLKRMRSGSLLDRMRNLLH